MPRLAQSERLTGPNASVVTDAEMPSTRESLARASRHTHAKRVRAGRSPRRPGRGEGWTLTLADEALLAAATRYGVLTWRQAKWRFYNDVDRTTKRRLGYLREAGLLRHSRDDRWAGTVMWPSAAGTALVREQMPVEVSAPQQHPGERLLHRLAVTDAGFRFELRGQHVLTERELRTAEGSEDTAGRLAGSLGVPVSSTIDGNGRQRWFACPTGAAGTQMHYPDLVVVTEHGLVAIEVEITPKPLPRLREIARGFRDAQLFTQVVWFATGPVGVLLHGYRDYDGDAEWRPGVLQQLDLLPDGVPQYSSDSPVRVTQFAPHDEGVAYRLDLRQVPDSWWLPIGEWRQLRAEWAADEHMGHPARVPFLRWWGEVHQPRQRAQLRAELAGHAS